MFVVMNRFQIVAGREAEFEERWRTRESQLDQFEGFVQFALLRNDSAGETTEYISHTTWRSKADFEQWRDSQQFHTAHAQGSTVGIMAGPPQVSLYEAVMVQENQGARAAST